MVACMESQEAKDIRTEEALAIKYENRPSSVFKYREINERSLRNLEDDLVWVCSPTDYNDPYESSISITTETLTSTILNAGVQHLIAQGLGKHLEADRLQKLVTA